jgi:hypothetical protein
MENFILGVVSSITATGILYGLRYQIAPFINFIFLRVYPKINGEYNVYPYDYVTNSDEDGGDEMIVGIEETQSELDSPNARDSQELAEYLKAAKTDHSINRTATIKQFANRVWGEMRTLENGTVIETIHFKGVVKPSRVVILNSEDVTEGHHDFGTMLLNISQNSKHLNGCRTYLCAICSSAGSDNVIFEKVK